MTTDNTISNFTHSVRVAFKLARKSLPPQVLFDDVQKNLVIVIPDSNQTHIVPYDKIGSFKNNIFYEQISAILEICEPHIKQEIVDRAIHIIPGNMTLCRRDCVLLLSGNLATAENEVTVHLRLPFTNIENATARAALAGNNSLIYLLQGAKDEINKAKHPKPTC